MATGSWVQISAQFPPKLVTNNASRKLEADSTPNCTGISPTAEGFMQTSSIPSVDTRTVRTYSVGGNTYEWHFTRLWRFNESQVIFGAPDYTDVYYPQGPGYFDMNELDGSTDPILKMLPLGNKDMAFMRAGGTNFIVNANDLFARWFVGDMMQEVRIAAATHAVELDGDIYYVNTDGFYKLNPNGVVEDIGYDVSGDITPAAVTADYNKKLIRIGDTHIYDVKKEKFFKYSGSDFVFETAELEIDNNTLTVTEVEFHYDKTDDNYAEIEFQTQVEERGYDVTYTLPIESATRGTEQSASLQINADTGKTFQLKINTLPSNIKLTGIYVYLEGYVPESRDS